MPGSTRHRLEEGDANILFFHLQACHRWHKNQLPHIDNEATFSAGEAKAELVFSYSNEILGRNFSPIHQIDLQQLNLPSLDLSDQVVPFTKEEISRIVRETPSDRAPRPDGFNGCFYKMAWEVVKGDILDVFQAMWDVDSRGFHLLNQAVIVLLRKNNAPSGLRDYRLIILIDSIGKLFSKGLAMHLSPRMTDFQRQSNGLHQGTQDS